jgi:hypothetical protein
MGDTTERPAMEFESIGVMNVLTDAKRRDILIAFEGDPNEEKTDMVIRLACSNTAALAVLLHKAAKELDNSAHETTVVGQVLSVSGAHSLESSMGQCMIEMSFLGFQIPLVMSKEVATGLISELYKSLEALDHPRKVRKPS